MPPLLRLPFLVYGYTAGAIWFAYLLLLRLSVTVRVTGTDNLESDTNYIFCGWHEAGILSIEAWMPRLPDYLRQRPHAWIVHSDWYTKPVWVILSLLGVQRLIPGSTGDGRRGAAEEIVTYLESGFSTFITPDGPSGPARTLKKGVLHMALQSGVPIVPLRVSTTRCLRNNSWDRIMQPLPFSTIHVDVGSPMLVTTDTFEETVEALTLALG